MIQVVFPLTGYSLFFYSLYIYTVHVHGMRKDEGLSQLANTDVKIMQRGSQTAARYRHKVLLLLLLIRIRKMLRSLLGGVSFL